MWDRERQRQRKREFVCANVWYNDRKSGFPCCGRSHACVVWVHGVCVRDRERARETHKKSACACLCVSVLACDTKCFSVISRKWNIIIFLEWVMAHFKCEHESFHIWIRHVTYDWVMARMNESYDVWMSHVAYEWVVSHINESRHTWMSHVTHDGTHMNETRHIRHEQVLYSLQRQHAQWTLQTKRKNNLSTYSGMTHSINTRDLVRLNYRRVCSRKISPVTPFPTAHTTHGYGVRIHWYVHIWHTLCCSVLQCVAVCCSVLQCGAVCVAVRGYTDMCIYSAHCVAVCCSVLQCVAVCCSVLQCVAVCCRVCGSVRIHWYVNI